MLNLFSKILDLHSFALFTHRNPDGDAIGSILALGTWVENQGKNVSYHISTPISKTFAFLEKTKIIQSEFDYENYDQIIFLDSANPIVMFEHFWLGHEKYFAKANTLSIDHHISNTGYAKGNIIDSNYPSCCELLTEILEQSNPGSITPEIANYLYMGISTDTGHFKHPCGKNTYETVARLISYGADTQYIIKNIYSSNTLQQLQFASTTLSKLQQSGNILWTRVDSKEVEEIGLDKEEANYALYQMQSLKRDGIIAFFDVKSDCIRCSLRTNNSKISVASIASSLDPCGGGHKAAAGCKFPLDPNKNPLSQLEDIVERLNSCLHVE